MRKVPAPPAPGQGWTTGWWGGKLVDVSHHHVGGKWAERDLQRAQVAQGPRDQWCLEKLEGHHKGGVT